MTEDDPAKQLKLLEKEVRALQRKLERSEQHRAMLEQLKDKDQHLLRTAYAEVEEDKRLIETQNEQLQRLFDELEKEKHKSEELLLNILPHDVANELKTTGKVEPIAFECVTVMFSDIRGFSRIVERMDAKQLIEELDYCFTAFDEIIERHNLEKLKTIGDNYMCAGGIPVPNKTHAVDAIRATLEWQEFVKREQSGQHVHILSDGVRIGLHSGPLLAGVIGQKKFCYDIWGDTVNIASRMESTGLANRVNISAATYQLVKDHFACEYRGRIPIKNRGEIDMYVVEGPRVDASSTPGAAGAPSRQAP